MDAQEYQSIDPQTAETVSKNVKKHIDRMLFFRRQYDHRFAYWFRQYTSQQDQRYFPDKVTPRANTFVPYPFSDVETVTSRTHDALFGYEPWFECSGRGANDVSAAEKLQQVLEYKLHRAKLQNSMESVIRNIGIYGIAAIKVDWDWDFDLVTVPQQIFAQVPYTDPQTGITTLVNLPHPDTGQPMQIGVQMQQIPVPRNRPKFIPIDIYDFLVDPDGGMVAHMVERTWEQLQREQQVYINKFGKPLYFPEALQKIATKLIDEPDPGSVIVRFAEFWNEFDNTCTQITVDDKSAFSFKDLRGSYRSGSTFTAFKRKMLGGEPIILWHGQNPFAHQRAPILYTSYTKLPHDPFGIGVIEATADLVEALNSMVSMIRDNWNLGINRRYAVNTDIDFDHDALNMANVPGGKVPVSGDPRTAIMELPTHTPSPGDYSILELFKGMIEMTSGISDFYSKGIGSPTNNQTATGISNIINESNLRFKLFIRNLELDILQPLLEMCASNCQQFMTDQEEIQITDEMAQIPKYINVQPGELLGTVSFHLVAANYATNETVRQRNLLAFAQMAGQSPYINEYAGLLALGKAFKIREIKQILKPPMQVQQEQMAQHQQELKEQIGLMMIQEKLDTEKKVEIEKNRPKPTGGKEGRPATKHFEGKIPGVGNSSAVRDIAQNLLGANSIEGMGDRGER